MRVRKGMTVTPSQGELIIAVLSGLTWAAGVAIDGWGGPSASGLAWAMFLATYALAGSVTMKSVIAALAQRRFEVDFLMLVAAVGAAAVGKWSEGAVLLFLFSLGHALEELALQRAERSIEALAELAPRTAAVRRDGTFQERPVEEVRIGDVLRVASYARVPVDGVLIAGRTAMDQSLITGESIPAEKTPVDDVEAALAAPGSVPASSRVFAGALNGPVGIEVVATSTASDSTLARVVELVRTAEQGTSPTQRRLAVFQRFYIPAVLGIVAVVFAAGLLLSGDAAESFYRAMIVLVAMSPCALAIAVPSAVLSGIARAARAGLLVKGGGPLEALSRVRAVAFDKTGTLTRGEPAVTGIAAIAPMTEEQLGEILVAVESQVDHPLARAVVRDLAHLAGTPPQVEEVTALTGAGVSATVDGVPVVIGSLELIVARGAEPDETTARAVAEWQDAGRTVAVVARDGRVIGYLGIMDTPRAEARDAIAELRGMGVRRASMLSGDAPPVARAIGAQVGVDDTMGGLLPEQKVATLERLRRDDGAVAMIGDGVNDAPAMARADVGIAMGAAGSAVALESADMALMGDNLAVLPFAFRISRATRRILAQNLAISLGIVAILLPAAILGVEIGPIVLVHEGSTLLVVLNALRLLRLRDPRAHAGAPNGVGSGKEGTPS